MYWPDYSPQKRKPSIWKGVGVLVVLILVVFLVGEIYGWWRMTPSFGEPQEQAVVASGMTREIVIVSGTIDSVAPPNTSAPTSESITTATSFRLPDLFDASITIALSDYAGQPVILNFWASWCVPCRTEMPALQHAYEQYQEDGLVVLGVNQLFVDNLKAAQDFVAELELTFPNVVDESGHVSEQGYNVVGLPTSVFINAAGEIIHVQVGQMKEEQIDSFIQQLIGEEVVIPSNE